MNSKRQSRYRLSYKNEAINAESQPRTIFVYTIPFVSYSCYPVKFEVPVYCAPTERDGEGGG
jgi:hypothetical protein